MASAALARAQTITWTGAGTGVNAGLWTFAPNWDQNRLPGPSDDVLIPAGAATVKLNSGAQTVRSVVCAAPFSFDFGTLTVSNSTSFSGGVTFNGGSLSGTGAVTLACDTTWRSGNLSGSGQLIVPFGRTLTISPVQTPTLSKPIVNQGIIEWTNGEMAFSGATITNQSGATLILSGASKAWVASGTNSINNAASATIIKSDLGSFQTSGGVVLNNDGLVQITAGTLTLNSAGNTTGTFAITTGAALTIATTHTFQSGSSVTGGGGVNITAGTTTTNGNVTLSNMALSSTLDGTGTLTLTGNLNKWLSGTMTGTGTTSIAAGATMTITMVIPSSGSHTLARTLENRGMLIWSAGSFGFNAGTINNLVSGTFQVSDGFAVGGVGGGIINNSGTLLKVGSLAAGFSTSSAPLVVNNNGTVRSSEGSLTLGSGGTHTGTFIIDANASLILGGTHTASPASGFSGQGTLILPAGSTSSLTTSRSIDFPGTVNVLAGTFTANGGLSLGNLNISGGGVMTGSGNVTISGTQSSWTSGGLSGSGSFIINSGARMLINGASNLSLTRNFDVSGTVDWQAGDMFLGSVLFQVKSGGTFNANPGGVMYAIASANATFSNYGTFNKPATGTVAFTRSTTGSSFIFNNFGTVNVNSGTLDLGAGGSSTGLYTIALNSTLSIGGAYTFGAGTFISGEGSFILPNTSTIEVQGNCTWSNTQITGGTITGGGSLYLLGNSSWSGGTMSGAGKTIIPAGATLNLSGTALTIERRIENAGTMVWTSGNISIKSTTVSNQFGGVFTMNCAASVLGAGAPSTLENFGTINKVGTGTVSLVNSSSPMILDNSGTLNVQGGTMSLPAQVAQMQVKTLTGGTWNVSNNATLSITNAQIRTLNGNVSLSGSNSTFTAINNLSVVNGTFALRNGRQFLALPNGGELVNNGLISLDKDCTLTVIGNFTQDPAAGIATTLGLVNGVPSAGSIRIQGFGVMTLGGSLAIAFASDSLPPCAGNVLVLSGAMVTGAFDPFNTPPLSLGRRLALLYSSSAVRVLSSGSGDFNGDGFLDFTDFDAFIAAFESGSSQGDFDGNGFIDFTDFDSFVQVFEDGC